jgi:hypothetical protein
MVFIEALMGMGVIVCGTLLSVIVKRAIFGPRPGNKPGMADDILDTLDAGDRE